MSAQPLQSSARESGADTGGSRWTPRVFLAISGVSLLAAALIMVWLVNHEESEAEPSGVLSHIHGMAVNPSDELLYVATHEGLFVLGEDGTPTRVGQGRQDLMGFTLVGPDHFLASGHPAPADDGPSHLGLIESTDAGRTWEPVSLGGEADFHVLRYSHGKAYGVDSVSGQLLVSEDLVNWEPRGSQQLFDLAVHPIDPDAIVATGPSGTLGSNDGGRTWEPIATESMVFLDWTNSGALWGVGPGGDIFDNYDEGVTWRPAVGSAEATPTAFTVVGETMFLATDDGRILEGDDFGRTWREVHPPAS